MVTKAAWPCCHTWNLSWPTSWRDSLGQSVEYLSLYFQHWLWRLLVWLPSISNLWGHLKCLGLGKLIQPYLKTLKCFPIVPVKAKLQHPLPSNHNIHVGQYLRWSNAPPCWGNYKVCVIYANIPWSHNLSLWNHPIPLRPPTSSKTYMYHVKLKLRFKCPNPLSMVIKFPTPMKIMIIKFPPPQNEKVFNALGMPKRGRAGGCWSFDLTDVK